MKLFSFDKDATELEIWLKLNANIKGDIAGQNAKNGMPPPSGYKYLSQEEFLIAEGQWFTNREPFTDEEYAILFDQLRRMRNQWHNGACYMNAFRLADWHPKMGALLYAEGMASNPGGGIPAHHAWAVLNGKVVDLTWMHRDSFDKGSGASANERSHNRMFAPRKLIARSERLRMDPACEYIGFIAPVTALYPLQLQSKVYASLLQDYENHMPLLKDGLPEEWKS